MSRRRFLKVAAGSTTLSLLPSLAWAANWPALDFRFPQDPLLTWFDPTYGAVRDNGRRHLGIDLMAPKLSPVFAIADGEVTRVAQSARAGRYAILDHNDGWQSRYLHLNNDSEGGDSGRADWDLTVADGLEEGARVNAGVQIAFVGDSGNAEGTNSHTHFELHLGSTTVNPWPYLVDSQEIALSRIKEARSTAF